MIIDQEIQRIIESPERSFFLFGPRGIGKSTWLKRQFPDATFINLLSEKTYLDFLQDVSHFTNTLNTVSPNGLVVIDEIQRIPGLLNEVHRFIEERRLRFALSGSSARKLKKQGVNLLAGRAVRRDMYPLLPEELKGRFDLETTLQIGSVPLVLASGNASETLEAYVQTYLKEEIQAEALVRNLQGFARFLPIAALFHGQVLSAAHLGRDAGVSRTTVLGYLEILEDTLLTFRLNPFEGKLRVKEKSHPKLYWIDPGVCRAARKSFGPVVEQERGALFEGWIASVLKAYQGYRKLFDDWNYWGPTASANIEVDFLLWRGTDCVAIEAKATKRVRSEAFKGLKIFKEEWNSGSLRRCIVVYLGHEYQVTDEGIEIMPLHRFLDEVQANSIFSQAY